MPNFIIYCVAPNTFGSPLHFDLDDDLAFPVEIDEPTINDGSNIRFSVRGGTFKFSLEDYQLAATQSHKAPNQAQDLTDAGVRQQNLPLSKTAARLYYNAVFLPDELRFLDGLD